MKRALTLIIIIAVCVTGYLSVTGTMPFMPVFGSSMEPEFEAGSLILIESIPTDEVEVGDVIVYNVPGVIREHYNYPPVVAHRVIEVRSSEGGVGFRTKGDNTGEDPFTVRAQDLRGTVSKQIPYIGFPLLFLQSTQGLMFLITALCLFALYLYADELGRSKRRVHQGLFAPVIEENRRSSYAIVRRVETTEGKIEGTEKTMQGTQQALDKFAAAIELYAEHLKSHTGAIQGLSEASHELKKGAAEQNRVLGHLLDAVEQGGPVREKVVPRAPETGVPVYPSPVAEPGRPSREEVVPEVPPAGVPGHPSAVAEPDRPPREEVVPEALPAGVPGHPLAVAGPRGVVEEETVPKPVRVAFPPGCFRTRRQHIEPN